MEEKKDTKQITRKELAVEGMKAIAKIEDEVRLANIIQDNKIEFKAKDQLYRVRKLTLIEQQEADNIRRKKYLELVSDDSYLFKKQWVVKYKAKGIDIIAKEKRITDINYKIEILMLRLSKTSLPKDIDKLTKEIEELRQEQWQVSIEVTDLLNYSIENQLTLAVNSYVTYLVLEKKIGDTWKKAFNSYEEFEKADNDILLRQAFYYTNHLMYSGENYESEDTKKVS